jgi:predicted RNase H-like HicB family nuclease
MLALIQRLHDPMFGEANCCGQIIGSEIQVMNLRPSSLIEPTLDITRDHPTTKVISFDCNIRAIARDQEFSGCWVEFGLNVTQGQALTEAEKEIEEITMGFDQVHRNILPVLDSNVNYFVRHFSRRLRGSVKDRDHWSGRSIFITGKNMLTSSELSARIKVMELTNTLSQNKIQKVADLWSRYAGEKVSINASSLYEPIYAFGSEIACLRLFYRFKTGTVAYSENLACWYYVNR